MKKHLWVVSILLAISIFSCSDAVKVNFIQGQSEKEIKMAARRASVMVQFEIPTMKVFWADPLPVDKPDLITQKKIEKLLNEKIEEAIGKEREFQSADKYSKYLVSVEGLVRPKSKGEIPIGVIEGVPEWARYPEKVLVVYKTKKEELSVWEKDHEKDVLSISETADVSIEKAKKILTGLKAQGYSVTKEEAEEGAGIKLIWFDDGWDDTYPIELDWEVCLYGEIANRITGYDPRGILTVQTIPDDPDEYNKPKKVFVKAYNDIYKIS